MNALPRHERACGGRGRARSGSCRSECRRARVTGRQDARVERAGGGWKDNGTTAVFVRFDGGMCECVPRHQLTYEQTRSRDAAIGP